uniref:Uncharacterized protein n=1 Tax=Arundo donax TaxID=35708 RepID=A0A0A9A723_ARUDO
MNSKQASLSTLQWC